MFCFSHTCFAAFTFFFCLSVPAKPVWQRDKKNVFSHFVSNRMFAVGHRLYIRPLPSHWGTRHPKSWEPCKRWNNCLGDIFNGSEAVQQSVRQKAAASLKPAQPALRFHPKRLRWPLIGNRNVLNVSHQWRTVGVQVEAGEVKELHSVQFNREKSGRNRERLTFILFQSELFTQSSSLARKWHFFSARLGANTKDVQSKRSIVFVHWSPVQPYTIHTGLTTTLGRIRFLQVMVAKRQHF